MPQGNASRRDPTGPGKRDNSPAAKALRTAVGAQVGARDALRELGNSSSPLSRGKLRRASAQADADAYDAAIAYRKQHQAQDRVRQRAADAMRPTDAQLDQFERAALRPRKP